MRYGAKSSSVPMKNWLSAVNSAWWALPSGVSEMPGRSSSSGSTFGEVRVAQDLGVGGVGDVDQDVAAVPVGGDHDELCRSMYLTIMSCRLESARFNSGWATPNSLRSAQKPSAAAAGW